MQAQLEATEQRQQLIQIDVDGRVQLLLSSLIGKTITVLGISGGGKTNTVAVLLEGMLKLGLPMTITDPEGEYWSLREQFQLVIAGRGKHVDLVLENPDQARELARLSHKDGFSVILDISGVKKVEREELIFAYMDALWESAEETRKPYELVFEEAHLFIPERGKSELSDLLNDFALRGRKRGLGIIISSQRSAKVNKDVITQSSDYFLHKVVHPVDKGVYKDLIPLPAREVEEIVGRLEPGQAVFMRNHVPQVIQVKRRDTYHPGATPEGDAQVAANLQPFDVSAIVKKLPLPLPTVDASNSKVAPAPAGQSALIEKLKAENAELRAQLGKAEKFKSFFEDLRSRVNEFEGAPVAVVEVEKSKHPKAETSTLKSASYDASSKPAKVESSAPASAPVVVPTAIKAKRTSLSQFEEPRFRKLLDQLAFIRDDRSPREEALLTYLIQHEAFGDYISISQIEADTGIYMKNYRRDFKKLLELPIIEREAEVGLRSCIEDYAVKNFPGVEPEAVVSRVKRFLTVSE
jgi:uncharacterized protein